MIILAKNCDMVNVLMSDMSGEMDQRNLKKKTGVIDVGHTVQLTDVDNMGGTVTVPSSWVLAQFVGIHHRGWILRTRVTECMLKNNKYGISGMECDLGRQQMWSATAGLTLSDSDLIMILLKTMPRGSRGSRGVKQVGLCRVESEYGVSAQ